jgi:hypothetical protein
MRMLEVMRIKQALVLLSIWISSALLACTTSTDQPPKGREVASQVSPTKLARAFIWMPELGALGATISQPYQVWLEALPPVKNMRMVLEADKTDGLRIRWLDPTSMEVCYSTAQITKFSNLYTSATEESPTVLKVEIVLRKVPALAGCPT